MLFVLTLTFFTIQANAMDCIWDRDTEMPTYPPHLMDIESWKSIVPTKIEEQRVIKIAEGSRILISCPQTLIETLNEEVAYAICKGDQTLLIDEKEYSLTNLGCSKRAHEDVQFDVAPCNDGKGQLQKIGFNIQDTGFYPIISLCFDHKEETLFYATHTVRGEFVEAGDNNPTRPGFKTGKGYFSVSANTVYSQDGQEELMAKLIGDSSIIDTSKSHFFARGHMAPDADFCTELEEDATYYYINVVPQWQSINNGNWKKIEDRTRKLADTYQRDLIVTTGPYGVLELKDQQNNNVQIYLGLVKDEAVIPAPLLSWKVIYDPKTDKGVALITSNNPFLTEFPERMCEDICDLISWIDFNVEDLDDGATYCCTVQDLRAVIPYAPDYPTAGILTN